ncbi:MAG: hypothetical protein FWH27_03965 [Planctomycetaceae bacterium]|nr:hypothetical protein [Planctomycetaceae bacterium]
MPNEQTSRALKWILIDIACVTFPCVIFIVLYSMIYSPSDYRVVKELRTRGFAVEYRRHDGSIKCYPTFVYRKSQGLQILTPDDCRLICQLPHLKGLDFVGGDLSGLNVDDIGNCQELWTFNCVGVTQFPASEIRKLAACPVKIMMMQGIQLKDSDLENFVGLTQLEALSLEENTEITDAGLKHLEKIAPIRSINLLGTNVTEEGIDEFKKKRPDVHVVF